MTILPNGRSPVVIEHGTRRIKSVYFGQRLVWPRASLLGIRSAALCRTHSAFVLNDGTLWTCGDNSHGHLCRLGPSGSWNAPNLARVPGIEDAIDVVVSCTETGEGSTVVLREHGRIHSAGANPVPTVSATNKIAYTALGHRSMSGSSTFSNFAEVLGTYYVEKIRHGRGRLFIRRSDGLVYGYGLDWDTNRAVYQWMPVKDPDGKPSAYTDLSAHTQSPAILRADGSVALLGPIADRHRPREYPDSQTAAFRPGPDPRFWEGVRKLATGRSHLAAITQTGSLRMAGSDRYGQLGSPKFQYRNPYRGYFLDEGPVSDVACGDEHTVILYRNGKVVTAGRNDRGQLGREIPVGCGHDWLYFTGVDRVTENGWYGNADYLAGIDDATAVYAGGNGTIIVRRSGIDVCGDNEFGQLGVATETHLVNSGDRIAWRAGNRAPFLTNRRSTDLFSENTL